MRKKSKTTKKYLTLYYIFSILSIILTFAPLFTSVVMAMVEGQDIVINKVGIIGSVIVTAFCCAMNIILKTDYKSYIWVVLLAVYVTIDNFLTILIILCVSSFLDEVIFSPAAKAFKNKYLINKEIDVRSYE